MINFQESITKLIRDMLDSNTEDVIFETILFHGELNETYSRLVDIDNSYMQKEEYYVPFVIEEMIATWYNVPGTLMTDVTIPCTIEVPISKFEAYDAISSGDWGKVSRALLKVVQENIGVPYKLGEDTGDPFFGTEGCVVFGFESPNPISGKRTRGDREYQQFSFNITALISKNVYLGNHVKYYLDNVPIRPINSSHSRAGIQESDQKMDTNTSKSVLESNAISHDMNILYQNEQKLIDLLKEVVDEDTEQNIIHVLKVEFPNFTTEQNVLIANSGFSTDLMSVITFSITYVLADEVLIE